MCLETDINLFPETVADARKRAAAKMKFPFSGSRPSLHLESSREFRQYAGQALHVCRAQACQWLNVLLLPAPMVSLAGMWRAPLRHEVTSFAVLATAPGDETNGANGALPNGHAADVNLETLLVYSGEPRSVVHCAGSGSVGFSVSHPFQDYQRTVATALAVLEYARVHAGGTRLVLPSSAAVYGLAECLPISVCDKLAPISPYGVHKRIAEDLFCSYGRHFGIACALVRLFSVYGIGLRKQFLWDACAKISVGDLTFSGTGKETRDFLHVEDAAELLILAGEHASPECPTVNGGAGAAVSIAEMASGIATALGCVDRPRFSGGPRAGDPFHYQADITEAMAWGWKPKRLWREEIRTYAQWYAEGAL